MMKTLKGQNSADTQKINRSLVLRTLKRQKVTTRAEISAITGLNKATVTNIVSDLIEWEAVREIGMSTGKSGRRTILIEFIKENYAIIAAWLKREEFVTGIFDIYGECIYSQTIPIKVDFSSEKVIGLMCRQLNSMIERVSEQNLLGVIVEFPGPYLKKTGRIALFTSRQKWMGEDLYLCLKKEVKADIYTEHDAKAATMAEWYYSCNSDENTHMMCIMIDQGVGSGVMEAGKIISGSLGTAGEIGHMSIKYDGPRCECGNQGCLEMYCTTTAIQKRVQELLPQYKDSICTGEDSAYEVIDAYRKRDNLAIKIIDEVAEYIGYGISNAINMFNPNQIIIGDVIPKAVGTPFLEEVKRVVKARVLPQIYEKTDISLSILENSVLRGACVHLMEEVMNDPGKFICNKKYAKERI